MFTTLNQTKFGTIGITLAVRPSSRVSLFRFNFVLISCFNVIVEELLNWIDS